MRLIGGANLVASSLALSPVSLVLPSHLACPSGIDFAGLFLNLLSSKKFLDAMLGTRYIFSCLFSFALFKPSFFPFYHISPFLQLLLLVHIGVCYLLDPSNLIQSNQWSDHTLYNQLVLKLFLISSCSMMRVFSYLCLSLWTCC